MARRRRTTTTKRAHKIATNVYTGEYSHIVDGIQHIIFNSAQELHDFVKDTPAVNHSRDIGNLSFFGCEFDAALSMLINGGYSVDTSEITSRADILTHAADYQDKQYQFDVTGDFFDIGLFNAGIPETWLYQETIPCQKPTFTASINIIPAWFISIEQIYNRGAALLAILDRYAETHILDVTFSYDWNSPRTGRRHCIDFKVNTENGFSRDLLCYVLANPGFCRRMLFAVIEKIEGLSSCESYGQVIRDQHTITPVNMKLAYFYDRDRCNTLKDAADYISMHIKTNNETAAAA